MTIPKRRIGWSSGGGGEKSLRPRFCFRGMPFLIDCFSGSD